MASSPPSGAEPGPWASERGSERALECRRPCYWGRTSPLSPLSVGDWVSCTAPVCEKKQGGLMYDGDSQGRWLEPLDDLVDLVRVDAKAGKCMRLG